MDGSGIELSHVRVGVSDFPRAMTFYTTLMSELGYESIFCERDRHWAGWMQPGRPRPLFLIGRAYDGEPVSPGNGHMVALLAPDRATVDRCHAAAIAAGVIDEGEPGLRPWYHANHYGAYFRDPDGNKLCICCHEPEG